jgi:Alpha/beta hydrolase of unknown function (DUF1400)
MNKHFLTAVALTAGVAASLAGAGSARAADQLTLINGAWNRSVSYNDLAAWVKNGETSGMIGGAPSPDAPSVARMRAKLLEPVTYNVVAADYILNTPQGEAQLDRMATVLAPRTSNTDGRQALRSAIIASIIQGNGTFTRLDLIRNYPTEARLNVEPLMAANDDYALLEDPVVAFMIQNQQLANQRTDIDWQLAQNHAQPFPVGLEPAHPQGYAQQEPAPAKPVRGMW